MRGNADEEERKWAAVYNGEGRGNDRETYADPRGRERERERKRRKREKRASGNKGSAGTTRPE
jgi:hypothetical protein